MRHTQLRDLAKSTVDSSLEVVDRVRKTNNSLFQRPSKPEIEYLCATVDNFGGTVLELTENCIRFEGLVARRDEEIADLRQQLQNVSKL